MSDWKKQPLILVTGPSGSGKDAVADELVKRYGLRKLLSYTTREPRFAGEDTHTFVTHDEFPAVDDIAAWTSIGEDWYCATKQQVDDADVYVIDGTGTVTMVDRYQSTRDIYFVFLEVGGEERMKRAFHRGSSAREMRSREMFDAMYESICRAASNLYENSIFVQNDDLQKTVDIIAGFAGLCDGQIEI